MDTLPIQGLLNEIPTVVLPKKPQKGMLRIAVVAPLFELIPPKQYGGTERVVSYLVESFVEQGHIVTLYAARGSTTKAELVECSEETLRTLGIGTSEDTKGFYSAQFLKACSGTRQHDIVHVHHGTFNYHPSLLEMVGNIPIVWTDHNAIHLLNKPKIFKSLALSGIGLTALSASHRNTVPDANWLATIHHGLPINLLKPTGDKPSYLAFLGRISREKGITAAVRIADGAGIHLKVAAKIDALDRPFYDQEVKPLFEASNVDYIGEIGESQKAKFLSGARALIFPICWKEPFGLVMIEAMACGCPVVAFRIGSVPEIVEEGLTGFIVDTEEEAIAALGRLNELDPIRIRQRFEEKFTSHTMADQYIEVYKKAIRDKKLFVIDNDRFAAKKIVNSDAQTIDNVNSLGSFIAAHRSKSFTSLPELTVVETDDKTNGHKIVPSL